MISSLHFDFRGVDIEEEIHTFKEILTTDQEEHELKANKLTYKH